MPRRTPYTRVKRINEVRANHVKGMGDVVFKGFQCLNSECEEFIFVRKDSIEDIFEINCPLCGFMLRSGDETQFFSYELLDIRNDPPNIIEDGNFTILHDDYIAEAKEYKYCIICNTLKPLEFFDRHSARQSGRQGECRLCKVVYNSIKNQTRITDQHREAAQKRRMYLDLSGGAKIDSESVYAKYEYKCFNCEKDLSSVETQNERPLDHTLPAAFLWTLTTANATLLCRDCNSGKSGKWPSIYYSDNDLKRLSVFTGIPYDLLKSEPHFNPEAIAKLKNPDVVDALLNKYAPYIDELIKLRNRILLYEGIDFFVHSRVISKDWIDRANATLGDSTNKEQDTDAK